MFVQESMNMNTQRTVASMSSFVAIAGIEDKMCRMHFQHLYLHLLLIYSALRFMLGLAGIISIYSALRFMPCLAYSASRCTVLYVAPVLHATDACAALIEMCVCSA